MVFQPPSGGCVLKQPRRARTGQLSSPAAFGRLCVETTGDRYNLREPLPAAFGRLCVETAQDIAAAAAISQPPSGGCVLKQPARRRQIRRLAQPPSGGCVLKLHEYTAGALRPRPAAFGRLCVETHIPDGIK